MIINDSRCKCGDCMHDGYCSMQRTIGYLQSVAHAVPFEIVLAIYVENCDEFREKSK